jgi:hypothetical protein
MNVIQICTTRPLHSYIQEVRFGNAPRIYRRSSELRNERESNMCKQDDDVKSPPSSSSGHNTGDAGNRLPVPSICTSLCLTYPRAIFCSTFLYMEAGYALRNILFCMTFLCRLVRIVGIPISLFVYYSDTGDSWAWLLTAFGTIATMTIGQILSARFAEFKKFAHLPGPKPSFFFGNYRDLCKTGWGDRHHVRMRCCEVESAFNSMLRGLLLTVCPFSCNYCRRFSNFTKFTDPFFVCTCLSSRGLSSIATSSQM